MENVGISHLISISPSLSLACSNRQAIYEMSCKLSRVFITLDPSALRQIEMAQVADQIIEHFQLPVHSSGERVRFPVIAFSKLQKKIWMMAFPWNYPSGSR